MSAPLCIFGIAHKIKNKKVSDPVLRYYLNMNLRYKITILIFLLITGVACTLGAYSYNISKQQIINKVSNSNQSVLKQIDSNLARMQKTLADWVTVFSLAQSFRIP